MRYLVTMKGYLQPEEWEHLNFYLKEFKQWANIEVHMRDTYVYVEVAYYEEDDPGMYEEVIMLMNHFDPGATWMIEDLTALARMHNMRRML